MGRVAIAILLLLFGGIGKGFEGLELWKWKWEGEEGRTIVK